MSFLSPLFLIGALAAALPILLHLLKRRPEPRVKFSAVKLLRDLPIEHTERRRVVDLLLLALRVAALLLLTMGFARPFLSGWHVGSSRVTVVALDTSLSMSPERRFARARQLARQAVDQVEPGGRVAILTFADGARVEVEPTTDRALARATITAAVPGFGATNYRAALDRAAAALGEGPGTIVVVTDLQESGWDEGGSVTVPETVDVRVADVGALPPNLAISAATVSGEDMVATVRNTGPEAREAHVQLTVDDRPAGGTGGSSAATVVVGAGRSVDVSLPLTRGRFARVEVDDPGGIEGDNARFVVLDGSSQPVVLVVTPTGALEEEAFYVQQALIAPRSDGSGYRVEGLGAPQLAGWDQARLDAYRGVILLSTRGLESRGRTLIAEYIRTGGGVLVAVGAGVDGDVLTEALGVGRINLESSDGGRTDQKVRYLAPLDVRHPVFGSLTGESAWGLVKFARLATLGAPGCQAVARFTTGEVALVDCAAGRGRTLVLASDLNNRWNDLPVHATFVPFIQRAMRYLSEGQRPSEYLVGEAPASVAARPGVTVTAVVEPDGKPGGRPADKPGEKLIAVNVDPRESDPRRLTEADFRATISRMKTTSRETTLDSARQAEGRQQLWRYLLAAMLVAVVLEGVLAARTA
ncbi:MAG: hypothetical protein DMF89_06615 [Acidobacteria bacterium]|nr:MAG: hypothetical protein DMF89_06615 [Acidobacteriota bacterium]